MSSDHGNLLCVANFSTDAGYAWQFIESLYAGVADDLARFGISTWVAYPRVLGKPQALRGSNAQLLELDVRVRSPRQVFRLLRAVAKYDIRVLYLTDHASWHPTYVLLRLAGVRRIVVHDHTSGERSVAKGLRGVLKRLMYRFRPAFADLVLCVSRYVVNRKIEVDLVPSDRVRLLLNSVEIPPVGAGSDRLRREWDIPRDRPVVACAARAAEYKGVQHLFRAFECVRASSSLDPVLIYFGDGPYFDELTRFREQLDSAADIIMAGYHPDAATLVGGADIAVVPSTWAEAFGLGALEPAARGVPVVASRVGGLPEVVEDKVTGLLVPPADVDALAEAIDMLLSDPERRRVMGMRGRRRAESQFSREQQMKRLTELFHELLDIDSPGPKAPEKPVP